MNVELNGSKRTFKAPLFCLLLSALALSLGKGTQAATIVSAGSNWRYLDDGSDQGTAWRGPVFNDSTWPVGRAQLGYGDGDEATVLHYGPNSTNKFITTYFRQTFAVANPSLYRDLTLSLLRDDGAVIYFNGREVLRSNMPAGAVNYRTLASSNVGGADENTFYNSTIAASNLVAGANIIAVEIHQSATNSTDISFDLQLVGNVTPIAVTPISPSQDANNVNAPASLSVALSNVPAQNLAVTICGRPAGPSPGADFTIIALPDTQCYVASLNGGSPEIFTAQTDWIVSQKSARNIVFVTQLGDCVENGDNGGNPIEWHYATNAMYRLENPLTTFAQNGIPYGVAVGNHDQSPVGDATGNTQFYNQFFGETHFSGHNYYGGHYGTNNDNHYELFSASGLDFVVLHLEYDTNQNTNVLNWANSILQTWHDRRAILVSHYILNANGTFGPQGQKIYDAVKGNTNLFLMLSGHDPAGESRRSDTFNGHTIHSVMADYQGRTNGGSGFLRIMEFSPSNNVIRVKTYSPTFNQFESDADSEFTLNYDMSSAGPFTAIGSFTGICCATNLSASWPSLAPATKYEWCVLLNDGSSVQTSAVWQFTTAAAQAPAPVFAATMSLNRPGHTLDLAWPAALGAVYQVVYRDNIAAGQWSAYSDQIVANNASLTFSVLLDPMVPHRFFAVRRVQ